MDNPVDGDPFRDLVRSTLELYSRFNVSPVLPDAAEHFMEEVGEFRAALLKEDDKPHIAEEAADVLVTLMGASFAAGLTTDELTQGVYTVIARNDAKTPDTHEVRDRKIRRRHTA